MTHGTGPDPLDRLQGAADAVDRRLRYESANRIGLLRTHAAVGLWAGPLILLFGGAGIIENSIGIWSRPVLALLALFGGGILLIGVTRRPRSIVLEAIGLAILAAWDASMTAALVFARLQQNDFSLNISFNAGYPFVIFDPLPIGYVVAYPIPIYVGYLTLLVIHLWTLRKLRKGVGA